MNRIVTGAFLFPHGIIKLVHFNGVSGRKLALDNSMESVRQPLAIAVDAK